MSSIGVPVVMSRILWFQALPIADFPGKVHPLPCREREEPVSCARNRLEDNQVAIKVGIPLARWSDLRPRCVESPQLCCKSLAGTKVLAPLLLGPQIQRFRGSPGGRNGNFLHGCARYPKLRFHLAPQFGVCFQLPCSWPFGSLPDASLAISRPVATTASVEAYFSRHRGRCSSNPPRDLSEGLANG